MHLKGLSRNECEKEQDGIDYMMMGNYSRKVSATQMNNLSSRSHCLFIISFEIKDLETGKIYHSKLNLGKLFVKFLYTLYLRILKILDILFITNFD